MRKIVYFFVILFFCIVYTSNLGVANEISNDRVDISPIPIYKSKDNITKIIQNFTVKEDIKLYSISIKAGTYAKKNTGNIDIFIMDSSDKILAKNRISKSSLIDNEFNQINFFPIKIKKNKEYKIVINIKENYEGNRVTFYKESVSSYDKKVKVDKDYIEGNLIYKLFFVKTIV